MNNRTLSVIAYITLIGWLIAYFSGKDRADALLKFHLKQALGLALISIIVGTILNIVVYVVPGLWFLGFVSYVLMVFWILGMINAGNGAQKPVPIFGKMFVDKFSFI